MRGKITQVNMVCLISFKHNIVHHQHHHLAFRESGHFLACSGLIHPGSSSVDTIIIIIGTTTHKESWPPSEVSSTLLDSWLLSTNCNPSILASFPTSPIHLAHCLPTFLSPSGCQSPRHTVLIHSCNMTSPPPPCNSDYQGESGLFKRL
jgi:hypothetical protein